MTSFVVDASVAAKWLLPTSQEPFADEAHDVLNRFWHGECLLTVPDLFWSEMGNILWKAVRTGRLQTGECHEAVEKLRSSGIVTLPSIPLLASAMNIAIDHNRAFYDCVYVALAVESKAPLLTADERLANALAARFPIRWLGAVGF